MVKRPSESLAFVPDSDDLDAVAAAATQCQACDLYKRATRVVFGEGPTPAKLMLVGEQPGDQEDQRGRPFVGPAGKLLDRALEEAEIPRDQVYVTNAVKHFKWEPRGKRRLHAKPNATEVHACHGWLDREIALVAPAVIVCLGATAAQALLGRTFRLTASRGELLDALDRKVLATFHPSALLRMRGDEDEYERQWQLFVRDLTTAGATAGARRSALASRRSAGRRPARPSP